MAKPSHLLLLAGFLLPLLSCAVNPVSGKPEVMVVSKGMEASMSEKEVERVEQEYGIVPVNDLGRYVQQLGARIAALSPRQDVPYTFQVVDMMEPNAFALPGGQIFVSRGLLAMMNHEDELVGVMAHEVGHVAARHSSRRVTAALPAAILGLPGAIVGTVAPMLGSILQIPAALAALPLAPYSRDQEREADRIGVDLAAKGGWDPNALATALAALELEDTHRRGEPRHASFADSHPSTPDRVERVHAHAREVKRAPANPIVAGREAFVLQLDGLRVSSNPKHGVFEEQTFLHPDLEVVIDFPKGWKTSNRPSVVLATPDAEEADAVVMVQIASEGEDPEAGIEKDGLDAKLRREVEKTTIHGLPAARLQADHRGASYDLTWIAHGGNVYRISGVTKDTEKATYGPTFVKVAQSFRPLEKADRARIHESVVRLARARSGEGFAALAKRRGSTWDEELIAIVNGIEVGQKASAGEHIKVGVKQRWQP